MKQLLFLVILVVMGYFIFQGGLGRVLSKANISTKGLLSDITQTVDANFIPEVASERSSFKTSDGGSFNHIKNNVFITYDPDVCYALVDLVYSSGSFEAAPLINEYLSMFSLPEDQAKILNLLNKYKDRQTLRILLNLYKKGSIERAKLLNVLSGYHTPEVAQTIHSAAESMDDMVLAQTAKKLEGTFAEEKWYKDGLQTKIEETEKAPSQNYDSQMAQF